jgi:hypothetical protein
MSKEYHIRLKTTDNDFEAQELLNKGYELHTVGFNSRGEPTYVLIYKFIKGQ